MNTPQNRPAESRNRPLCRANLTLAILLLLMGGSGSILHAQNTIHMKDGRKISGKVGLGTTGTVVWSRPGSSATVPIKIGEVSHVEFTPPPSFSDAMDEFEAGNHRAAAAAFARLADQRSRGNFYPVPGNFASLSQARLLDCYHRMEDWPKLRRYEENMEWDKVPPEDRTAAPIMAMWSGIGAEDWDKALAASLKAAAIPEYTGEAAFGRALAHGGKGDTDAAVLAFAECFGPYPGLDRNLAGRAMEEAARILGKDEERQPEMKSLIHTYTQLYGNGRLWENATALERGLQKQKINLYSGPKTASNTRADKLFGAVKSQSAGNFGAPRSSFKARYIRISLPKPRPEGLEIAEVEVMAAGYNIAKEGKAKMKWGHPSHPAGNAIDGKTAHATHARTDVAAEDLSWELEFPEMTQMDAIVVWARHTDEDNPKPMPGLAGFTLQLFDGERKEIFKAENQPDPDPKLEIDLPDEGAEVEVSEKEDGEAEEAGEAEPAADGEGETDKPEGATAGTTE